VLLFTLALAELSLHDQMRVVSDVGLASISLFSVMIAVFLGSSLLYKEIERKTLYVILPKPIRRAEFLLGKYFGIVLTAVVFVALMGALQLWLTALQAGASPATALVLLLGLGLTLAAALYWSRDRTAMLVPFATVALAATAWLAQSANVELQAPLAQLTLCAVEVAVLASVALLFSSFSTPFLTGIFTLGIWVLGRSADDMATMKSKHLSELTKRLLHVAAEILPNLQLYVPGRTLLYGQSEVLVWPYVATSAGYGVLYAALLLSAATFIFQRRDFL
jgi:ABC-type transport system involved in multi-copper enzyme maturation permease subunit